MTVEKAKEKMCLFNQIVHIKDAKDSLCVADYCMAWRWCDLNTKREGYCGLAGKEGAE